MASSRGNLIQSRAGQLQNAQPGSGLDVSWYAVTPKQPSPSLDPYRAPVVKESATPGPEEQAGSFATRVSLVLAVVGVVLFWGVLAMVRVMPWEYKPTQLGLSLALMLSLTLHLVGLGVLLAAPAGRRLVGFTANAVGLLLLLVLIAIAIALR
jgi:hypothetical protein